MCANSSVECHNGADPRTGRQSLSKYLELFLTRFPQSHIGHLRHQLQLQRRPLVALQMRLDCVVKTITNAVAGQSIDFLPTGGHGQDVSLWLTPKRCGVPGLRRCSVGRTKSARSSRASGSIRMDLILIFHIIGTFIRIYIALIRIIWTGL